MQSYVSAKAYGYDNGIPYSCLALESDFHASYPRPVFLVDTLRLIFDDSDYEYRINEDGDLYYRHEDDEDDDNDVMLDGISYNVAEKIVINNFVYYRLENFCFGQLEKC